MKKNLLLFFGTVTLYATAQQVNDSQPLPYLNPKVALEERVEDALARMTTHEKIQVIHAQSKFTSAGVPRLGIRQLNMDDGPHGVREELEWNSWGPAKWTNDSAVAFPSLTCLAATWNRELATRYGHSVSEEFAYRGKDVMLGPGANIQRTPLNGRAFEYLGEDPCLAGEMVVSYIKAAQKNGVGCCMKHFVLNDQETDRYSVNVNVSERAMREIYLRPFQKAVEEAHVWSIMGSYNRWQNVQCCHNDALLNGILKGEWQWDGALVSDWNGTHNTLEAATGGLDIEMGTENHNRVKGREYSYNDYYLADAFEKLIEEGKVPMATLDEKVRRVLRLIFRTAMNPDKAIGSLCSEAHFDACRQIGEEGIVLLKNKKSILPLDERKYQRILVVGENATRSLTKGGGSSELKTLRDISPLEALRSAYGNAITYAQGYTSGRTIYNKVDAVDAAQQAALKAEALDKAKEADLILFIGGMNKNHHQDCEDGDRESYDLSFGQNELIAELAKRQKNIVVVTFGGNPYAMPWIDQVAAVLHCWYLGSEAGTALTNVLNGKVCPSGKLPVTFARRHEDYPYMQYGAEAYPGVDKQVHYKEGIFVGYRHFDTHHVKPLFPFGFGLSYTTFEYGKPSVVRRGDGWEVSLAVTNTGTREGKEVVELYLGAPALKGKGIERPDKELKNFAKVSLLPGEKKQVSLTLTTQDLSYWDESSHAWKADAGRYRLYLCASSEDVRQKVDIDYQP